MHILKIAFKGVAAMTVNVGRFDRIIRLIVGLALIAAPFLTGMPLFQGTVGTTLAFGVGLILVGTSALKFCPLYRILGIQTCKI
jgi:hypothetical protein